MGAKKFTFIQIHTFKGINKPLLRLALYNGKIKAFIRTLDGVKKVVFNEYKGGFLNILVQIKGNKLKIKVDNKEFEMDVGYWNYKDYFKAGVYLQSDGCAKAIFKKLTVN
jgi:hypothetical protein